MIVLIVWGVFSVVYISWNSWEQFKNGKMAAAFNEGASQGYSKAFVDVANAAKDCQPVPLNLGSDQDGKPMTMEIIATACLQQAQDAQASEPTKTEKK